MHCCVSVAAPTCAWSHSIPPPASGAAGRGGFKFLRWSNRHDGGIVGVVGSQGSSPAGCRYRPAWKHRGPLRPRPAHREAAGVWRSVEGRFLGLPYLPRIGSAELARCSDLSARRTVPRQPPRLPRLVYNGRARLSVRPHQTAHPGARGWRCSRFDHWKSRSCCARGAS
jgi:hypothetical protein